MYRKTLMKITNETYLTTLPDPQSWAKTVQQSKYESQNDFYVSYLMPDLDL